MIDGKVFICDDEEGILRYLKKMLERKGLGVATFDSGSSLLEAMEKGDEGEAALLLLDVRMPDMDGITATEIISNTVPESPIIMMSVQGEQDYLRRSMLAGAREFLVKPFSADELVNAIRHVHELEKVKRARYAQAAPAGAPPSAAGGGAPSEKGKVITLFSPKGGVGRTTIATNLAVALHQATGQPVALVDGSLLAPDLLDAEVLAVMRRESLAGRLRNRRAEQALDDLRAWDLERIPNALLLSDAWSLRHNVSAYDALYVAAARRQPIRAARLLGAAYRLLAQVGVDEWPVRRDLFVKAREVGVARLVAAGMSNREIATALVVSERTVTTHLNHIFSKLGVSSRTAVATFMLRNGLT